MANHPLYIGGPPTRNYSRAQFPAPTFDANNPEFSRIKVAAHKNPAQFDINRTLDFANEASLVNYVSETTFAQGDTLDVILFPRRTMAVGLLYSIEVAGPDGLVLTPSLLTDIPEIVMPAIAADVADNGDAEGWGFSAFAAGGAWATVSAEGPAPFFIAQPSILRLTLTTFVPADGFGDLRIHLCPVVTKFEGGAW